MSRTWIFRYTCFYGGKFHGFQYNPLGPSSSKIGNCIEELKGGEASIYLQSKTSMGFLVCVCVCVCVGGWRESAITLRREKIWKLTCHCIYSFHTYSEICSAYQRVTDACEKGTQAHEHHRACKAGCYRCYNDHGKVPRVAVFSWINIDQKHTHDT